MAKINCWVGIDPGTHGAAAVLRPDGLTLHRFPLTKGKTDYGKLWAMLNSDLFQEDDVPFIGLEHTQGVGRFGASTNHSLGWNNGFLHGWVMSQSRPYELVKPQAWQKVAWSPSDYVFKIQKNEVKKKDPKPTSEKAAIRLFPNIDFAPGKLENNHDGLMDAALIAYYAKRVSL